MKKIVLFGLLFNTVNTSTESFKQEVEEVIQQLENKKITVKPAPSKKTAVPTKQKINTSITIVPDTSLPQPMKLPAAPKAQKQVTQKAVSQPTTQSTQAFTPQILNPSVQLINTSPNPITVFTASSLEDGPEELNQTSMNIKSYSSAQLSLTSQNQKAVGAQLIDQGMISNNLPITLTTPWAVLDISATGALSMQYLPAIEQNSIIIINPYSFTYTVRILNHFSEDIHAEEVIAKNVDTGYMILELQLPARSSIALPVLTTKNIRLHLIYTKNNQSTRINYPTAAGFYVLQELPKELIPRRAFQTGVFTTGENSNRFLYLQQIDA